MDFSGTPRAKFSRKRYISSATTSSPYQSPMMHSLPEKKVKPTFEDISDVLNVATTPLEDKNIVQKVIDHQVQQKFVSSTKSSTPFRSPLAFNIPKRKIQSLPECLSLDEIKTSTMLLWEKNKILKQKIQHLELKGLKEDELKWHIDKLHSYNEIKDVAQKVMGRLAIDEQKTIKEVHEDFGMTESD